MGNKCQTGITTMLDTLRQALSRAEATLIQDLIGGISLVVILVGALHLPSF